MAGVWPFEVQKCYSLVNPHESPPELGPALLVVHLLCTELKRFGQVDQELQLHHPFAARITGRRHLRGRLGCPDLVLLQYQHYDELEGYHLST